MLERTSARALPLVNRAAEHAPMATACCNACRTCVTSNLVGLVLVGAGGVVSAVSALGRRKGSTSSATEPTHEPVADGVDELDRRLVGRL
jgi:hypothetical protein